MAKTVKIKIDVDDVKFDVFNTTHRAGLAIESADETKYRTAAQMTASVDDTDILQIERSIGNAAARIKTELGEYLKEPSGQVSTFDNRIPEAVRTQSGQIEYDFDFPANFNANAVDALQGGIHDYLVASTIVDWFTTTNPGLVAPYAGVMKSSLENAKRALYKRSRPKRPAHYGVSVGETDTTQTERPSGGEPLPGGIESA